MELSNFLYFLAKPLPPMAVEQQDNMYAERGPRVTCK